MKRIITIILVLLVIASAVGYFCFIKNQPKPINSVSYFCNSGKSIDAKFYKGETKPSVSPDMPPTPGGSVSIKLSDGRKMTLPQTISADGARYANQDESFIFWSKNNGALVLENNQEKSYIGCILVSPDTSLPQIYSNSGAGFSIRLPKDYTTDETYKYQALGPEKEIGGIKFTIPNSIREGTNLSADSYISVEEIPQITECNASIFALTGTESNNLTDTENETTYSVANTNDAGAGNRYEETIYAIPFTNPCVAVRYFVHYSVFENYPEGSVKEFDKKALISEFDKIRRSLIVNLTN